MRLCCPFLKDIYKTFDEQMLPASENTHDLSLEFGPMTNAGETNAYDIPGL